MKLQSVFLDGIKFGALLHLNIGPIAMLLFSLGAFTSPLTGLCGALGAVMADFIYISLAVFGISAITPQIKKFSNFFKIVSGIILVGLGLFFLYGALLGTNSVIVLQENLTPLGSFVWLLGLTLLNPLTIVVFTGIFSNEALKRNLNKSKLKLFALGLWITSIVFLPLIVVFGYYFVSFLPYIVVKILNACVGLIIMYWGIRNFITDKK